MEIGQLYAVRFRPERISRPERSDCVNAHVDFPLRLDEVIRKLDDTKGTYFFMGGVIFVALIVVQNLLSRAKHKPSFSPSLRSSINTT